MGAGTAAGTANIEVGSLGVGGKDHAYCKVNDAIVGISGYVVKELVDGNEGGCGGSRLLGSDFAEGHQQFVFEGSCVIEEGPKDFLNAADTKFIKRRAGVDVISILGFGAVVDGLEFVRGELGLVG